MPSADSTATRRLTISFRDCPAPARKKDTYRHSSRSAGCCTRLASALREHPGCVGALRCRNLGCRCAKPNGCRAQRRRRRMVCPRSCRLGRLSRPLLHVRGLRGLGAVWRFCLLARPLGTCIHGTGCEAVPARMGRHPWRHVRLLGLVWLFLLGRGIFRGLPG